MGPPEDWADQKGKNQLVKGDNGVITATIRIFVLVSRYV
jgi:hypothetical protein